MGHGRLLEACQVHEKVALEHSSKSTKYELEGSYGDPVHEHFSSAQKIQTNMTNIRCETNWQPTLATKTSTSAASPNDRK